MLLWTGVAQAAAPSFEATQVRLEADARELCFGSGLRVGVLPDEATPIASIVTIVDAGAQDDPEGKSGLAHLVEHLWFLAAAPGGGSVNDALDRMGTNNAYTTPDVTMFLSEVGADDVEAALALEGRRFTDFLEGLDEASFNVERRVVARELLGNQIDSFGPVYDAIYQRLFPAPHPYHLVAHHDPAAVERLTLADARQFVATHYRPENVTVHLAGAVAAERLSERLLGLWPQDALITPASGPRSCREFLPAPGDPPAPPRADTATVTAAVPNNRVMVSFSAPGGWTAETRLNTHAVEHLEKVFDHWLESELVVGSPACGTRVLREASIVTCQALLRPSADAARAEKRMRTALGSIMDVPVTKWSEETLRGLDGWARGRALREAEAMYAPLSTDSLAPYMASHIYADPRYVVNTWSFYDGFNQGTIFGYALAWFKEERAVFTHVRSGAAQAPNPVAAHRDVGAPATGDVGAEEIRAQLGGPASGALRTLRLANGVTVVVLPHGRLPLVGVELVFRGGDDVAPIRGAWAVLDTLEVWWGQNVGFSLNVAETRAGLQRTEGRGPQSEHFRVVAPADRLTESLWMLRKRVEGAKLVPGTTDPAEELAKRAAAEFVDPGRVARRLAYESVFGSGALSDIRTWKAAQNFEPLRRSAWLAASRQPAQATVVITGAIDMDGALALANQTFGTWPLAQTAPLPSAVTPLAADPAPTGIFLAMDDATSARIEMTCPVDGLDGVARDALDVGLDSWLYRALRERAGMTYDPSVWVEEVVAVGPTLHVAMGVSPQDAGPAVADLRVQLTALAGAMDAAGARRIALATAAREQVGRGTMQGMMDTLRQRAIDGNPETWFSDRAEALAGLEPAPLATALRRCAAEAGWAVVGRKAASSSLTAAGLRFRTEDARTWTEAHLGPGVVGWTER